jgi:uncharacterized membrane protein YhaH (DUF805 family)
MHNRIATGGTVMDPNAVIEVFRRNLTEHFFDLKGRVSRKEFWYFVLASFVVYIAAAIVDAVIRTGLLVPLIALALLLPMTGLGARRLQDVGRNGQLIWVWTIATGVMQLIALLSAISGPFGALGFLYFFFTIGWLISLVALGASIALIYFCIQPGSPAANEYGPVPDAGTAPPAKP